jgi:hypothetical protein
VISKPGAGGRPGPWHRLSHCADDDLPPELFEQRHSLSYWLVEVAEPREMKGPGLVPDSDLVELICGGEMITLSA